ncbi:MAG: NAD(P)H-dependent oxidoreductase [Afipia sp.]|nr:NAD(P)H-dependent oxidoreductase [Afipia sp.]
MKEMKIVFLSGSSHVGSANWKLASAAASIAKEAFGDRVDLIVLDLMEYDLPRFEAVAPNEYPVDVMRLKSLLEHANGIFVSSDEYTGAYSTIFRNAVRWLRAIDADQRTPFDGARVALCGTSGRGAGGLRGQPALQQFFLELGAEIVVSQQLEQGTLDSPFTKDGTLVPKLRKQLLEGCLTTLCERQARP